MKNLIVIITCLSAISCNTNLKNQKAKSNNREQIMFTSKRDGNFEVYVMKSDSTELTRLTQENGTDYGLNWSPDGKHILFYSDRNGNEEVFRMNADGSHVTNLSNSPANERDAAYSPDGKKIIFISDRDQKTRDLYQMNADGTNVERITYNKLYCESPRYFRSGEQILFTLEVRDSLNDKKFKGELFSIWSDGSLQKRLTYQNAFVSGAEFSPQNKKIAYHGKSDKGNYDIFIMNADGTDIRNITDDKAEDYSPSWSPDGQWIAFTSGNASNYDIWKINFQTKEKIRLTSVKSRDETPHYKPKPIKKIK